nr:efflux RND transporter periplasmic adaptor subunit [uncultured Achromobacter sp.]
MKMSHARSSAVAAVVLMSCASAQPLPPIAGQNDPNAIRVLLSANPESTISAPMTGRLETLDASLGQAVAKDAVLVQLECAEPKARLRMANAELAGARESLKAKVGLRKLDAAGDTEVNLARAATDRAAAATALAQAQVDYCVVGAPYSGRVAKVYVRPHESVAAGAPLFDLVGDGPLKVRMNVPSRSLRDVKIGTEFQIDVSETGKTYRAVVSAINARVDAVAQSIELEAQVHDPAGELLPGMTGIADFPSPR